MKFIKNKLVIGTLLCILPYLAIAEDVRITINGKVVANPCTVETTSSTVDLGDLFTFDFLSAGSASTWHDINLKLISCPEGTTKVTAMFSGTPDGVDYYKNSGSAQNIQIQLQDDLGNNLNNGSNKRIDINEVNNEANFPLRVRVISASGNATQGNISSVITVTYTYS
ncbi:fimbrial protein [Providencia rettgeri]